MAETRIKIKFLQNPTDDNFISYNILNNGQPLVYTSGVSSVMKKFSTSKTYNSKRILSLKSDLDFGGKNFLGGFNAEIQTIVYQSTGKMIVNGYFSDYDGITKNYFCRLNTDGTLDNTFTPPNINSFQLRMAIDQFDNIFVVGGFTNPSNRIVKLNPNGVVDSSFNVGTGFNTVAYDVAYNATTGKVIVTGGFTTYKGVACPRIIMLNADGSKYSTFNVGVGFSSNVNMPFRVIFQSDGKVVVGGKIIDYKGTSNLKNLVRINDNGVIDSTFVTNVGSGLVANDVNETPVYSIKQMPNDYTLIVAGAFNKYNGTNVGNIVKVNINGAIVGSFIGGTGFDNTVYDTVIDSSYNVIAVGKFNSYKGTTRNRIAKIDKDGGLVSTITYTFGNNYPNPSNYIRTIARFNDTNIVIGGEFSNSVADFVNQTQTDVPIGIDATTTQASLFTNLGTFNIGTGLVYTSSGDTITVTYTHDPGSSIIVNNIYDIPDYVTISVEGSVDVGANMILSQSPYISKDFFTVGTVDTAILDLFIYKGDYNSDIPLIPTYTLTKQIVIDNQDTIYFNVSNFLREFNNNDIDKYLEWTPGNYDNISIKESTWLLLIYKKYYNNTKVEQKVYKYLSIDGYGWVEDGVNPMPSNFMMSGEKHRILRGGHNRFYFITSGLLKFYIRNNINQRLVEVPIIADTLQSDQYVMSHLIKTMNYDWIEYRLVYNGQTITKRFNIIDECFNNPIELIFKNKYGFLQSVPFEKKSSSSYSIDSKSFDRSIMDSRGNYNTKHHSEKTYLVNGNREFTLNTGYVDNAFNVVMKELLHSSEIYLREKIIKDVKSPSLTLATFEIAFDDIRRRRRSIYDHFRPKDIFNIIPVQLVDKSWTPKSNRYDGLIQYTIKVKQSQETINKIT